MKTICELFGIEYPILQGGMAWVATAELAAAVSQAGGLGIIGAGNAPPEVVEEEVDKARRLTDRPFGVNIYFMSPYIDQVIDLLVSKRVPVVTTGAGNPGKYIDRFKEVGTRVVPVVASVALAKRLERVGVDALIAEGMECGGHIGEITTMALVPQIVDAVRVPVIAAGGIYDGRGMAAAFALGAQGVQMGTRFICAKECTVHPRYKQAIIKARDRSTTVTGASTGHPVRVLKNKLSRTFQEMEQRGADREELERLGANSLKIAAVDGDVEMGSLMAGQVAAMVTREQTAAEIIDEVMRGFEEARRRLTVKE